MGQKPLAYTISNISCVYALINLPDIWGTFSSLNGCGEPSMDEEFPGSRAHSSERLCTVPECPACRTRSGPDWWCQPHTFWFHSCWQGQAVHLRGKKVVWRLNKQNKISAMSKQFPIIIKIIYSVYYSSEWNLEMLCLFVSIYKHVSS